MEISFVTGHVKMQILFKVFLKKYLKFLKCKAFSVKLVLNCCSSRDKDANASLACA